MRSMKTRLGAVLAVLTVFVGANAGSALAQGQAYGVQATVSGLASVPPTPVVTNPPGGTTSAGAISGAGITATVVSVSSNSSPAVGQVSNAQLSGVAITEAIAAPTLAATFGLTGGASVVQASCTFPATGTATGSTTLAGLNLVASVDPDQGLGSVVIFDNTFMPVNFALQTNPAANTKFYIGYLASPIAPAVFLGTVTLNEQIPLAGGGLTVNAIHIVYGDTVITLPGLSITIPLLADIIISSATCTGNGSILAVTFRSLSASPSKSGVVVRWRTASEVDTLGFHVYRQVNGTRVRVNTKLIAAKGRGSYSILDRKAPKAKTVRYWVQVVNLDGTRSWYGPARVVRS